MFLFSEKLTFWWPVKVIEPNPDVVGEKIERVFEVEFELLDPDEQKAEAKARNAIVSRITPELSDSEIEAIQANLDAHDLKVSRRAVKNWRGVTDTTGTALAFSPATFERLYRHHRIRNALVRAYLDATNDDKARLGN